jgi:hypothetical protein
MKRFALIREKQTKTRGIMVIVCMAFLTVTPAFAGVQDTIQTDVPALKNVFAKDFYVGCLLSYAHIGFSTDPYVSVPHEFDGAG